MLPSNLDIEFEYIDDQKWWVKFWRRLRKRASCSLGLLEAYVPKYTFMSGSLNPSNDSLSRILIIIISTNISGNNQAGLDTCGL